MQEKKYKAFISYSHRDETWAARLHKALETYSVPKLLVGKATDNGIVPKRLSPIFRDREELPSATDLSQKVDIALEQSACLIVICSPDAARSRWVNEEILAFKRLGNSSRIFSLIVGGEPNSSIKPELKLEECFPEALRYELDDDGSLSSRPAEPIAADARPGKDGRYNAKLKLISGMLGVGFDELKQRELHRRNRRMALITIASLAGMVIATTLATMALLARAEAERQRVRAEAEATTALQTTNFLVDLFKVSDPSESRAREITADELLEKGAARIEVELADQPDIQATLMDTMGSVYTNLGAYERASDLLQKSLDTREVLRGPSDIKVAQSLNHLARVQMLRAEYASAEQKHRRALNLRRELLGEPHVDVAQSMNDLGDVLSRMGDYEAGEGWLRLALSMRRELLGDDHPDVAQSLEDLALNIFEQGDYEQPLPLLREAIAIRQQVQGDPHPDLAEVLNNLGNVLYEHGEYGETERLWRQALAMKRKLLPAVHPEIATGINNLAYVLHDQGDYEGAETMYLEVIEMRRQLLGDDHPEIGSALNNLAYLLYDKGERSEALQLSRESLNVYRKSSVGEEHPDLARAQNNLGMWLMEAGEYEEAEVLLREALTMRQRLLDEKHPDVAGSMTLLANLLISTGRYREALGFALDASEISAATFNDNHWRTAIAKSAQGAALAGMGRFEEAEPLLLRSHEVLSEDAGALPVFVTETERRIATLYELWGRSPEASASKSADQAVPASE